MSTERSTLTSASSVSVNGDKPKNGDLTGDKATRIVEAMRKCVANHGATGATFDHVAREAGVSRGLLHYYFGTKERLLIEVVRRETDRLVSLIRASSETASSAEQLVDILLARLKDIIDFEPELFLLAFEIIGEARRHPEIGAEVAEYNSRTRGQFAEMLEELQQRGSIQMRHSSIGTASALLSMTNGLALEIFEDPDGEHGPTIAANVDAALYLLGAK
ncbi:MAG: TetR/AcrR family transcriptional regulator [Actinobacteria bacterium]|nr:TetR/AcrR family transcriptional regulator [Actinomycetota bacterium]